MLNTYRSLVKEILELTFFDLRQEDFAEMLQLILDLKHEVFSRELMGRRKDIPGTMTAYTKVKKHRKVCHAQRKKLNKTEGQYAKCRMSDKE